eukprot:gnl/TRDRNA2_/TRDRNA2_136386_c0_seq2.p1 gnl/TRDRNA2_/TRDRNA2_136386_c0~~gnl/TRDRNA2_/TRDRNA2_136386_c0_seq2.p1  ORF type:complete len:296 (-),score=29.82 gnl/TRDRNA2_/TRDRNA2_136386_c0_seq2:18-905(-)
MNAVLSENSLTLPPKKDRILHIEGAEALLQSLHGSLQRSTADFWRQPSGLPRRWQVMRSFSEMRDADSSELSLWCSSPSLVLPQAAMRERIERGGAMAIVRDVSDSMSYLEARCASLIVNKIVDLARRSHMRVGYSEFGHESRKHFTCDSGSHFFTRDYFGIQKFAESLRTQGSTHYQAAIQDVLSEFEHVAKARGLSQRMHTIMLSDGEPTVGCRELHMERAWAQRLGVCIHTIFIGQGQYPPVLARLAMDTGGKRFQAVPCYESRSIQVVDKTHEPVTAPVVGRQFGWGSVGW